MMDTYYATYAAWSEVFAIFAKYEPDATFEVSAEHDIVYAGRAADKYSAEDKQRLEELHWNYDANLGCYYHYV